MIWPICRGLFKWIVPPRNNPFPNRTWKRKRKSTNECPNRWQWSMVRLAVVLVRHSPPSLTINTPMKRTTSILNSQWFMPAWNANVLQQWPIIPRNAFIPNRPFRSIPHRLSWSTTSQLHPSHHRRRACQQHHATCFWKMIHLSQTRCPSFQCRRIIFIVRRRFSKKKISTRMTLNICWIFSRTKWQWSVSIRSPARVPAMEHWTCRIVSRRMNSVHINVRYCVFISPNRCWSTCICFSPELWSINSHWMDSIIELRSNAFQAIVSSACRGHVWEE